MLLKIVAVLLVVVAVVVASASIASARGVSRQQIPVSGGKPIQGVGTGIAAQPVPQGGQYTHPVQPVSSGNTVAYDQPKPTPAPTPTPCDPLHDPGHCSGGPGDGPLGPVPVSVQSVQAGGTPVGGTTGIAPSIPIPPPVTSTQQSVQPYQTYQGGTGGTQPAESVSLNFGHPVYTNTQQDKSGTGVGGEPVKANTGAMQPVTPGSYNQPLTQIYKSPAAPIGSAQTGSAPTGGNQPVYEEDEPSLAAFWRTGQSQQPPQSAPGSLKIGSNNG